MSGPCASRRCRPLRLGASLAALVLLTLSACAPPQAVPAADSAKAPVVILISGDSGTAPYGAYARAIEQLGYRAILVAGRSISSSERDAAEKLRALIEASQRDARAAPGKVVVIGFSLGGGLALVHAAPLADTVAGVVAYYPSISRLQDIRGVAARVAVPTLVLAGEQDRYFNCCLIESMRAFDAAARAAKAPVWLVSYPNADHGFNLDSSRFRADDSADAWVRTRKFLAKYHPLP